MAVRAASIASGEQETDPTVAPRRVYWIAESASVYVTAVGSVGEGDGFLLDEGSDVYVLTSLQSEEDKVPYLIGTSTVMI